MSRNQLNQKLKFLLLETQESMIIEEARETSGFLHISRHHPHRHASRPAFFGPIRNGPEHVIEETRETGTTAASSTSQDTILIGTSPATQLCGLNPSRPTIFGPIPNGARDRSPIVVIIYSLWWWEVFLRSSLQTRWVPQTWWTSRESRALLPRNKSSKAGLRPSLWSLGRLFWTEMQATSSFTRERVTIEVVERDVFGVPFLELALPRQEHAL
ncbi:unnamed protein product [Cuscuta campestris]|uniref:Uncharacterized protein n=1 Tax=Cuscuta campestris TaxID=132261 RepID=A0A484N643_9ASTE|nr:unnamed protein product [Cuscuta campestris]